MLHNFSGWARRGCATSILLVGVLSWCVRSQTVLRLPCWKRHLGSDPPSPRYFIHQAFQSPQPLESHLLIAEQTLCRRAVPTVPFWISDPQSASINILLFFSLHRCFGMAHSSSIDCGIVKQFKASICSDLPVFTAPRCTLFLFAILRESFAYCGCICMYLQSFHGFYVWIHVCINCRKDL